MLLTAVALFSAPVSAGGFEDGLAAHENLDDVTAARLWRRAAETGHAVAQYRLGRLYYFGEVMTPNYIMFPYLTPPEVMNGPEFLHHTGKHVERDYDEALRWFRRSADQSYPPAMMAISEMYAWGLGVAENAAEAGKWFYKAVEV
jgi:TPR repeat protein